MPCFAKSSPRRRIVGRNTDIQGLGWLYGTTSKTNISVLQCFQSKVLRQLCGAPWYVRNEVIHRDLQINTVSEEIRKASLRYKDRIKEHPNKLATRLLDKPSYRHKRTDPRGLSVE
ncbi:hypothetical protein DMENIID0001_040240 [Sergentomyia squamirostris]